MRTVALTEEATALTLSVRQDAPAQQPAFISHHRLTLSDNGEAALSHGVQTLDLSRSADAALNHRPTFSVTRYIDSYLGWFRAIDRTFGAGLNPTCLLASAARI